MKTDENTNIKSIKKEVQEFVENRDWTKFHTPKNLSISLSLEVAELMEIFQWKMDSELMDLKEETEIMNRIKEELADVIIYSLSMANALDIDITEAVFNKIEANSKKYPINKAYGKADKYTEL